MVTTNGTYLWSFVTEIFRNGQPGYGGDSKQGRNNNGNKKARAYIYPPPLKIKIEKKIIKKLLTSFAFVHARLLPKVIYCQCRLVACSE